jgi:nitroreductase
MSHPKHADASHEILDIIRTRWSPRAFDASRLVTPADLHRLFEAARWAPSSFNEQPWRFVVADRERHPETYAALLAAADPVNQRWAQHAPVLVLVAASPMLARTGRPNQSAWYDAGQAVGFLTLQATSMGLSLRQMEGFDRAAAAAACGMPPEFEAGVLIALGYAGEPTQLAHERDRAAETQPRMRRPIGEFVYEGSWGKSGL